MKTFYSKIEFLVSVLKGKTFINFMGLPFLFMCLRALSK